MTIEDFEDLIPTPETPLPPAPAWHVDSRACPHGWIVGHATEGGGVASAWGVCDCEDPAHPWPPRASVDGPRDCGCHACDRHQPRWERGRLARCEHRDHHCAYCHERGACTRLECAHAG